MTNNTIRTRRPRTRPMLAALLMTMVMPAVQAADARQPILLNEEEQGFVLNEMRQYVVSLQQILTALADDDVITVGQAARTMGMQAMSNAPPTLMGKLPMAFRQLGMPTHKAFDEIADAAESGETTPQILSRLGTVLNNCVACHASYRLAPAAQGQ